MNIIMNNTKKICYLGVMTALYVVLSAFFKFNLIGNIQIDLGYIVFAIALCMFGLAGAVVGVLGCAIESMLFSAYGFSISWFTANLIVGLICGRFYKDSQGIVKCVITFAAVLLGVLGAKTLIECVLYSIPLAVKLPKNLVAFAVDFCAMGFGIYLYDSVLSKTVKGAQP